MRRLAVTVLFALALVGGLVPGLARPAPPAASPFAAASASPVAGAPALDLAAMALTPADLDRVGLTGFGQQTSALQTTDDAAAQLAPDLGQDPATIAAALAADGFMRGYARRLALPARPGDRSARQRTFVDVSVLEYASAEGAAAGFALSTTFSDPAAKRVPGAPDLGDESALLRRRLTADDGEPAQALALTVRLGRLVAGVTLAEVGRQQPDVATIDALGDRLLANLQAGRAGAGPGLSNLALRLGGVGVLTRSDEYGRAGGQTFPNYAESPTELAERAARYGAASDVYGVGQDVAAGGVARGDDVHYLALIFRFGSEAAAEAWLREGAAQALAGPNVVAAAPVPGAPTIGAASLTLAMTARSGTGTAKGYLIDVRVGAEVAQVRLMGQPDVPLAAVEALAREQAACLQAGRCPDRAAPPAGLPPLAPPAPAASPAAGGTGGAGGDPCGAGGDDGSPVAASPVPRIVSSPAAVASDGDSPARPNFIVIVTDDLDARSVACLPTVRAEIAAQGASFANFLITTPLCCPSRASILRGQYAHNHGVRSNTGLQGGFPAFFRLGDEESTVATWLHDAGYRTALLGKYLNRYPEGAAPTHVPPGWDEWAAFVASAEDDEGGSFYEDYVLNENGAPVAHGHQPEDYSTDVLAARAAAFVTVAAAADQPFFLYLAPYAPHGPSTPAPRDTGAFADAFAPRVPSFNEADVSDKPAWVRQLPALSADQTALVDDRYRRRLRSLLAVDAMVGQLVATLEAAGALDDTYIVFTSDNGYHLGEHRIPLGKLTPYEEAIRTPLLVRGPGVAAGRVVDDLALNIDLAPTFAALAGASPPDFVDGRSLAPLLRGPAPPTWRQAALIEHFPVIRSPSRDARAATPAAPPPASGAFGKPTLATADAPPYFALRTRRYLYVELADGEREMYDLRADPYELDNAAARADPALLRELAAHLAALRDCAAAGCRAAEDAPLGGDDGGAAGRAATPAAVTRRRPAAR